MDEAQKIIEESELDRKKVKKEIPNITISKSNFDKLKDSKKPKEPEKKNPEPKKEVKKKESKHYIKSFLENQKGKIEFIKEFLIYSIIFGLPINYALWAVFNVHFGFFTFPGFGVLFYFIRYEIPDLIRSLFWRVEQ